MVFACIALIITTTSKYQSCYQGLIQSVWLTFISLCANRWRSYYL